MNILKQIHSNTNTIKIYKKYRRSQFSKFRIEVRCFFTEAGTFTVDENFNLARFPGGC